MPLRTGVQDSQFVNFFNINKTDGAKSANTITNPDGTFTTCYRSNSDWAGEQYDIIYLAQMDGAGNITRIKGFELTGSLIALSQYTDCVVRRNAGYLAIAGTATIDDPSYASVLFMHLNAVTWEMDNQFVFGGNQCNVQLKDFQAADKQSYALLATSTCYNCNGQEFGENTASILFSTFNASGSITQQLGFCSSDRNTIFRPGGLAVINRSSYLITGSINREGALVAKIDNGNLSWAVADQTYPNTAGSPVIASDGSLYIPSSVYRVITSGSEKGADPAIIKFNWHTAQVTRAVAIGHETSDDFQNQFVAASSQGDDIFVVGGNNYEYSGHALSARFNGDLNLSWSSTLLTNAIGGKDTMSSWSAVESRDDSFLRTGYVCEPLSLTCKSVVANFPVKGNLTGCQNISFHQSRVYDVTKYIDLTPASTNTRSKAIFNTSHLAIRLNNTVDLVQSILCEAIIPASTTIGPAQPTTRPPYQPTTDLPVSTYGPTTTASPDGLTITDEILIALAAALLMAGGILVALFAAKKMTCKRVSMFAENKGPAEPLLNQEADQKTGEELKVN